MEIHKYGVIFEGGLEIASLWSDERHGHGYLIKGKRQEVEVRVTKSGLLRIGNVRKAGPITCKGDLT